jgi:hypothetical protein
MPDDPARRVFARTSMLATMHSLGQTCQKGQNAHSTKVRVIAHGLGLVFKSHISRNNGDPICPI